MSGARVSIPNNVRKTIQNIKEITCNHTEDEIYVTLKECSMDPNETVQKLISQGLARCGKSCRLRWMNYLRPTVKRGNFSKEEEDLIDKYHKEMGNKWSAIAAKLPGRSDNEIKNHWHTHLKKRSPKHFLDLSQKEEQISLTEQIMQFNGQPLSILSTFSTNVISNESIASHRLSKGSLESQKVSDDSSSHSSDVKRELLIDLNQEYVEEE